VGDVPVSVVVATTAPWPALAACLDSIGEQVAEAGGEIVVVDRHGAALSPAVAARPEVVWLRSPGDGVFALRALGAARARGNIVALTEDHCEVAPDWVCGVMAAHAEHPEAAAVAGSVRNGATASRIDRASFLLVHGLNLAPMGAPPIEWLPSPSNLSFKRAVFPSAPQTEGWLELVLVPALRAAGRVATDDTVVVTHDQSLGRLGTVVNHFHAGRTSAALQVRCVPERPGRRRVGEAVAFPRRVLGVMRREACHRPGGSDDGLGPAMTLLAVAGGAGLLAGFVAGPGESPRRLH